MKRIVFTLLLSISTALALNAQEYHLGQVVTNPDGSQGVIFYLNENGTSGWMVALHDASLGVPWGNPGVIEGLPEVVAQDYDLLSTVFADTNGYSNTLAILQHYQSTGYMGSYAAETMDIDNGWYLPAAGQLKMLYVNAVFYEPSLESVGEKLGLHPYWSSTQGAQDKAWYVHFGSPYPQDNWAWNGNLASTAKNTYLLSSNQFAVRAIRDLDFAPAPTIGLLQAPPELCSGGALDLALPDLNNADSYGWEIASDRTFSEPVAYTGQGLDATYNGWYLRLWATNSEGTRYSNIVSITIDEGPQVGEIEGQEYVYYNTNGLYTYSIDSVPGAYGYAWRIDNDWIVFSDSFDSPQCSVDIASKGIGTLTVRVYTSCGYVERTLVIHHEIEPGVNVFPNPTDGKFRIQLYGLEGTSTIEIYNGMGQLVDRFEVESSLQGYTFPYSLTGKAAGVYVICITNGHSHFNKRLVKNYAGNYGVFYGY